MLIWDAKVNNLKVVQGSNVPEFASSFDADLRHHPLYAARTIDIDTLVFDNTIEFEPTDSGLHMMSFFECSKNVLTGDLGFDFVLSAHDFDVNKSYECDEGLSRKHELLGALVAHLHEEKKTRIMADIDWNIKVTDVHKQKWKLRNEVAQLKHDLFWSQQRVEDLEEYFANRLNRSINKMLHNENHKAAMVAKVVMPLPVARKWFIDLHDTKFMPDEEPLKIVQRNQTWTTKGAGFCPKSYLMDTYNRSKSYAYLTADESRWYDFTNPNITYDRQTDELTFEGVKIYADVLLDSTAKRWRRV